MSLQPLPGGLGKECDSKFCRYCGSAESLVCSTSAFFSHQISGRALPRALQLFLTALCHHTKVPAVRGEKNFRPGRERDNFRSLHCCELRVGGQHILHGHGALYVDTLMLRALLRSLKNGKPPAPRPDCLVLLSTCRGWKRSFARRASIQQYTYFQPLPLPSPFSLQQLPQELVSAYGNDI